MGALTRAAAPNSRRKDLTVSSDVRVGWRLGFKLDRFLIHAIGLNP
jgi:hypothetical protein